jgi:hypothetical protein
LKSTPFLTLRKEDKMKEDKKNRWQEPELDVQASELTRMFYGNNHFQSIRGKLAGKFIDVACGPLYEKNELKSRTKGKEGVEKFFKSVSLVAEKIGVLERQGMFQAAKEVRKALADPNHCMLGEIESFKDISPVTMVMFEAKITLCFLSKHIFDGNFKVRDIPRKVRRAISVKAYNDRFYAEYVFENLKNLFVPYWKKIEKNSPEIWKGRRYYNPFRLLPLPEDRIEERKQMKFLIGGFAQFFMASKEEIERLLTPEECAKTAFWEFNLPRDFLDTSKFFETGLHLATEHSYWQRMRASFCSLDTSFGRGAIFNPGMSYHCFDRQSEKFKGTRLI